MNAPAPQVDFVRHRFTIDDLCAMQAAGVIDPDARIEVIEGELIDMPEEGPEHTDYSAALGRWLYSSLSPAYIVVPGSTLRLSPISGPKPDWYVFSSSIVTRDLAGEDVLLAIEQAHSSVSRDLGWKADLYARHGVRDYWVIDIDRRELHVHREPTADGYGCRQRFGAETKVAALLIPGLLLRLDRLTRVGGSE